MNKGEAKWPPLCSCRIFSGAVVTIAHQLKVVEFANLILYDPNSRNFRNSLLDRNLLYVSVTPACSRLDIVCWRELAAGLE